jgi:hypothetical protein
MYGFRWNEWNLEHATRHGIGTAEAETVVIRARRPWPQDKGNGKMLVEGRGQGNRMVRVVYIIDAPPMDTFYIIHAMPLTTRRRRQ